MKATMRFAVFIVSTLLTQRLHHVPGFLAITFSLIQTASCLRITAQVPDQNIGIDQHALKRELAAGTVATISGRS